MPQIEPFLGLYYNPEIVGDISKVVCPPYDIIDVHGQEGCYQKHPYNIIRLILGKDFSGDSQKENKYTRAAAYIEEWTRRNVFKQDKEPAIYYYEQIFTIGAERKRRLGLIALMRLDEHGGDKTIYPHEHTHAAPKEDRLSLMKSVEANLSPIFTIYSDTKSVLQNIFEQECSSKTPFFESIDDNGIENRIWRINQKPIIDKIKAFFKDKEIFIADGHHRYEVAKMFKDYKKEHDAGNFRDSYNYIMTYFTRLEDDGLCILPTHRLLKNVHFNPDNLTPCFVSKEVASKENLLEDMKSKEGEVGNFGLYKDKKFYLLKLADKRECNRFIQEGPKEFKNLDVVILHKVILEYILKVSLAQIGYEVNLDEAVKRVDEKAYDALFILNPTKIEQIRSIALSGEVMPQKSTYFYPKLVSGFLIHKF